jgi:hypothetical protein
VPNVRSRRSRVLFAVACAAIGARAVAGSELVGAGDIALRHEVQLLADAGVLRAPVSGWALSGDDLQPSAGAAEAERFSAALRSLARYSQPGLTWSVGVSGINEPFRLRSFETVPREEAQQTAGLRWTSDRLALAVNLTHVGDPSDGSDWRLDGSYVGVALGNWIVAASAADRWWGPGWDGSLILSNDARPIPALTLHRRQARPMRIPGLRWIGPWTTQILLGQLESDRARANARLFGWRFGFRPVPKLEIGFTRTAQWCGTGRPCDLSTFADLLTGLQDNPGERGVSKSSDPGNQLAGFDLRYAFSVLRQPLAFYGQRIGEDERDGLPSAWLSLFGIETWKQPSRTGSSYRIHVEYAETTCGETHFGCAYNHTTYTDGYRYRGRPIGHPLDGDGTMTSLGVLFVTGAGHSWNLLARHAEINRGNDPRNTLSLRKQRLLSLELSHRRYFAAGMLAFGVSREQGEYADDGSKVDQSRLFVSWTWMPGRTQGAARPIGE